MFAAFLCLGELSHRSLLEGLQIRAQGGRWTLWAASRLAMPLLWGFALLLVPSGIFCWLLCGAFFLLELLLPPAISEPALPTSLLHVQAHEQAHHSLNHRRNRLLAWSLLSLLWLVLLASQPLEPQVIFWTRSLIYWTKPLFHHWYWCQEYAADQLARQCCGPQATQESLLFLRLGSQDLHPWFALHYSSHPPPAARIARC